MLAPHENSSVVFFSVLLSLIRFYCTTLCHLMLLSHQKW